MSTSNVIPLRKRHEPHPPVVLTFAEAHHIAILLRDLRQYADSRQLVDRAIQRLTSPTNGGAA